MIESLVAFAVVSLGTVSVMRLQRDLRFNAELSGQRVQAAGLAQASIERDRAVAGVSSPASSATSSTTTVTGRNTRFTIDGATSPLDASTLAAAHATQVAVSWPDTTGTTRAVSLSSLLGMSQPALSAALSIRAIDAVAATLAGRHPTVPVDAVDLGQGRSAWKLTPSDGTVWLFDNATGRIVSRCNGPATMTTRSLTAADFSQCTTVNSSLLSGIVRTSLASPPDPSQAVETPEPMKVVLALSVPAQAVAPLCVTDAEQSVQAVFGTGLHAVVQRLAAPLAATPASIGAERWTDLGERFAAYRCVVAVPPGGWSGSTSVLPDDTQPAAPSPPGASTPWAIGLTSDKRRICRYVPAGGGSAGGSAIDPNMRHPAVYTRVTTSLTQQNFLVVRGDQDCPRPAGDASFATEQQQP